jgi:hypothetical protein
MGSRLISLYLVDDVSGSPESPIRVFYQGGISRSDANTLRLHQPKVLWIVIRDFTCQPTVWGPVIRGYHSNIDSYSRLSALSS